MRLRFRRCRVASAGVSRLLGWQYFQPIQCVCISIFAGLLVLRFLATSTADMGCGTSPVSILHHQIQKLMRFWCADQNINGFSLTK